MYNVKNVIPEKAEKETADETKSLSKFLSIRNKIKNEILP